MGGRGAGGRPEKGLSSAEIERLYRAHAQRLAVHLARETLDPQTGLDLMAETFAVALAERKRFRGSTDEEAVAWLWGIARHRLSGYWRRGSVERRALARLGVDPPNPSDAEVERLEELAGVSELRKRVAHELARLPADQREALRLRIVDELSYEEVAARLGVSQESVRARVSRGLRRLRDSLLGGEALPEGPNEGRS